MTYSPGELLEGLVPNARHRGKYKASVHVLQPISPRSPHERRKEQADGNEDYTLVCSIPNKPRETRQQIYFLL